MYRVRCSLIFFIMVVICSFNCNGLKQVNNFQNFVSMLNDRRVSFALLQETFWDKAYIDGIKHMFEGKIYECNGTNGRQGVAIMVSNECKEKTKLVYKDNEGRFIHVTYEIKVITKLPNSEQSYKGKVKTHNYINRQNQSTTGKL